VYEVAVHWGLEEAQQLCKLRVVDVPSPINRDYKWTGKLTPFKHQEVTSSFLTLNKKAFCFNEQGTGKTASVIWAADYLLTKGYIKRILVLCPLSIMKSAWQQDLFKFAMHRSCSVAHGSATQRKKILSAGSEFVIINFDGVAVIKDEIMAGGFDMVVVDEANAYKNAQTNRWKVLRDIVAKVPWLWMLTGTPAAQSPVDAFGLAKLVNPENTPTYFGRFRDDVMYKVTQYKWAPKPDAQQTVHKVLQPAIRFERAQCLDLPPLTYTEREAPLTPQQNKYYQKLRKDMVLEAAGPQNPKTPIQYSSNLLKIKINMKRRLFKRLDLAKVEQKAQHTTI
jgi:SNF2 family DNA or RNA helicase